MKHILLTFLFYMLAYSSFAGFNDWSYKTDNGTYIADESPGCRISTDHTNKELENVKKWYFYKDHIIGEYVNSIEGMPKHVYFILNELNGDIQTYNNTGLFEEALVRQHLKPALWTRWYEDHFQILEVLYILIAIFWLFYWYIAILFFLIVLAIVYGCFFVKNKLVKIGCITFTSFLLFLFLLTLIHDYYVYSI